MSFLLDVFLVGLLVIEIVWYARRTIFGATSGCVALALAAFAAFFLVGPLSPVLSSFAVTPLVENTAANQLADMYSAEHLSSGRETVAALPLGELVAEQPDAYLQLLEQYNVEPAAVLSAYQTSPSSETVLVALTATRAAAVSDAVVFLVLVVILRLLFGLIAGRIEDNFPPPPRYHGVKKAIPAVMGAIAGVLVLWVAVTVFSWVVPVMQGQILFLSEEILQKADGFSLLRQIDPFLLLG